MSNEQSILALDIGSTTVRAVLAQIAEDGDLNILNMGQAKSLGVERGVVVGAEEASYAIRAALEDARVDGKARGLRVFAGFSGKHLRSVNTSGQAPVSGQGKLVSSRDVARAVEACQAVQLEPDQHLLHLIPRGFQLDGYRCRRDPVGMHGSVVKAEGHLVLSSVAAAKNLRKAVQMAGRSVEGLMASGIAAGQAVLRPEEKEMGVILLDIGGGVTDIVAYSEGVPCNTFAFPVGGNQIANDVAVVLNTSFPIGEQLYREQGAATPASDSSQELTVACFGAAGQRNVRRQFLNEIIAMRLAEILSMAFQKAQQALEGRPTPAGIVLTGGVANLPSIDRLAEQVLGVPVRVGKPLGAEESLERLRSPSFATAVGVLQLASGFPLPYPRAARERASLSGLLPWWAAARRSMTHAIRL